VSPDNLLLFGGESRHLVVCVVGCCLSLTDCDVRQNRTDVLFDPIQSHMLDRVSSQLILGAKFSILGAKFL
jgi:hypothetical protein